jgi:hypothetical protein
MKKPLDLGLNPKPNDYYNFIHMKKTLGFGFKLKT